MAYRARIIEQRIKLGLQSAGGVWLRGPKSCGKTDTASQFAKSILNVDTNPIVPAKIAFNASELLEGAAPRLLDEWQAQPQLWNLARHEIDKRKLKGQFILTGSATPNEDTSRHSGAGRFIVYEMGTMSWQEMGWSTGQVSLSSLLKGEPVGAPVAEISFGELVKRLIKGGWPGNLDISLKAAQNINHSYLNLLAEEDMSQVAGCTRDPQKVLALLKSVARNISTPVSLSTLAADSQNEVASFSRQSADEYLAALKRLMVIVTQPAYNAHIRSRAELRQKPKLHFCDTSLAAEGLNLSCDKLEQDQRYLGLLFESQVFHDLLIYAAAIDASVSYYRDSNGNEVDAIVETRSGELALFEVKLGNSEYDVAAENLKKVAGLITKPIKSLNIITGPGITYPRPDGVNIISLATLGSDPK